MQAIDHDINNTYNSTANILIPSFPDKTPIIWEDGCDATISGILYEVGRYYTRTGLFQTYLKHHAVPLANGKLAIDHPNTAYWVSDKIKSNHNFDDPCSPTSVRFAKYTADAATAGTPMVDGMTKCRCGINGGKHLFRDCPQAKEKAEAEAKKKEAELAKAAFAGAGQVAGISAGDDQLRAALAALLSSVVPTTVVVDGEKLGAASAPVGESGPTSNALAYSYLKNPCLECSAAPGNLPSTSEPVRCGANCHNGRVAFNQVTAASTARPPIFTEIAQSDPQFTEFAQSDPQLDCNDNARGTCRVKRDAADA